MVALVSVETVLLVLLVVLVAALLRSHAEILRRLGPQGAAGPEPAVAPAPVPAHARTDIEAPEIAGATPTGDAIKLSFGPTPTLLAFLSSGCTSCASFWDTLGDGRLPAGLETVIVTGLSGAGRSTVRGQPASIRH